MASFAEILALQAIAGSWGSDLVNDTAEYVPPKGYAIKMILAEEETVINYAYQWSERGMNAVEQEITSADKNWIDATLAAQAIITTHDRHPISRLALTSGSVMVYFCKGPSTADMSTTTMGA
jgi:hypothetical protein